VRGYAETRNRRDPLVLLLQATSAEAEQRICRAELEQASQHWHDTPIAPDANRTLGCKGDQSRAGGDTERAIDGSNVGS
jgi:hypothetical protein